MAKISLSKIQKTMTGRKLRALKQMTAKQKEILKKRAATGDWMKIYSYLNMLADKIAEKKLSAAVDIKFEVEPEDVYTVELSNGKRLEVKPPKTGWQSSDDLVDAIYSICAENNVEKEDVHICIDD